MVTEPGIRRPTAPSALNPRRLRLLGLTIAALLGIVLVFAARRLEDDVPHLVAGTLPVDDDFAVRYVQHPVVAYLHIGLGVGYLLGAPLQLSHRFRSRHYAVHRRLGRALLSAGLLSGVFALVFGLPLAFGGVWEAIATVLFGSWRALAANDAASRACHDLIDRARRSGTHGLCSRSLLTIK